MYQHLTKLLLAGVVAVILAVGPTNAFSADIQIIGCRAETVSFDPDVTEYLVAFPPNVVGDICAAHLQRKVRKGFVIEAIVAGITTRGGDLEQLPTLVYHLRRDPAP